MRILQAIITLGAMALASAAAAEKRVVSGALTLMDGPGTIYRSVQSMASGTRVELLETYEGYGLIRLPSGVVGWAVARRLVRPGAHAKPAAAPVVAAKPVDVKEYTTVVWPSSGNLNLRAGPGTNHPVTLSMPRGDIVAVFQKSGNWVHVRCITGEVGWTHTAYLSK